MDRKSQRQDPYPVRQKNALPAHRYAAWRSVYRNHSVSQRDGDIDTVYGPHEPGHESVSFAYRFINAGYYGGETPHESQRHH